MFTDGNDDYTYVLPMCFALGFVDYGQLIKLRRRVKLWVRRKLLFMGELSLGDIEATDVENFNSILRERLGRFVRESSVFLR